MWPRRKRTQKDAPKDEAAPPGYKAAPPGYKYWSPTSSSPQYYRKPIEPDEPFDFSRRSFGRKVLWIVLGTILAVDLVVMYYGGYLSSWLLLTTRPSGIFLAVVGLVAAIGLLAG